MTTPAPPQTLPFARAFARQGLAVVPLWGVRDVGGKLACACGDMSCKPAAKHPNGALVKHGLKDATRDEGLILKWFGVGSNANLGIVTGPGAPAQGNVPPGRGVVVIDLDEKPQAGISGRESLAALERQHGELPPTWRFNTGGGGQHIMFAWPERGIVRNSAGKIGPGIDVRGLGGYIVAPPSRHVSGRRYEISVDHHPQETRLAPLPDWLAALLVEADAGGVSAAGAGSPPGGSAARGNTDWRGIVTGTIGEGGRNDAVARLAGKLLAHGIDAVVALELCLAWNGRHCAPPLDDTEVVQTVNSIAKTQLKKLRRNGEAA